MRWRNIALSGAAFAICAAVPAAAQTVYTDEAAYLSAVAGNSKLQEGFEDQGAWGPSRWPAAVSSITSQGITWASNLPANGITTSGGPALTGEWGFYSNPHGDQDVPNSTDPIEDGFTGSSDSALKAIGGWFSGTFGSQLILIVDGNESNPIGLGSVDSEDYRFYGVVFSGSFTTFEFREIEGTKEDQKLIFADDFTIALDEAGGGNNPPTGTIVQPSGDVTVEAGNSVFFEGSVSDPDGDATTVLWEFGDGGTSTLLTPGAYVYTTPGAYTATMTATDSQGASDPTPDTRNIEVGENGGNNPPTGTIVQPSGDVTVEAGNSVFFEGSVSDPDDDTTTVLWEFGDGGTSTSLTPGAYVYSTPGAYTATLTATDSQGAPDPSPDTRNITVTDSQTSVMTGVVSGVADVRGAAGSDWHTDLFLHNASAGQTVVELYFSPSGGTVGTPVTFAIDADGAELLPDVVSNTFGTSGTGAIFWRVVAGDQSRLLVSANTYNRVDDVKRYGVYVPGVLWNQASPMGTSLFVPGLAGRFRTNLGFSTDADCTSVTIRAIDRFGVVQDQTTVPVEPYSWQQINKLFRREFPDLVTDPETVEVADSLHRFEVVGVDGRIVTYTTIIDNLTSDGSYMLGQWAGSKGQQPWLTGAAFTHGANASQWRSDVMVFNLSGSADSPSFTFFPSQSDNSGDLDTTSLTLQSEEGRFQGNILSDAFALPPPVAGSLEVAAAQSVLWMRTYSEEPSDNGVLTYGLAIPPFAEEDMIDAGSEGRIAGFNSDDRNRSNLILQNTLRDGAGGLIPATVRVSVIDAQGTVVHQQGYQLRSGEYLQKNNFINKYGLGWIVAGTLKVVLTSVVPDGATGGVVATVSEVNGATLQGTNDGRLIPAAVLAIQ